jgi:signal transduction histidine kinase/CheY-like chemotaxis protein
MGKVSASVVRLGGLAVAVSAAAVGLLLAPGSWRALSSEQGFMPHGHCYLWQPRLVALHVASDSLIGLAYLTISLTLAYLVYRTRSLIPFHWMILAFGGFIIACGATHLMEVWTLWHPTYWLSGNVKLVTAVVSVATAIALPPLVPRVLALIRAEQVAEDRLARLAVAEERAGVLAREAAARADAEAARAEAEAANRAKDQFLAMVSHELRNPLSPILAWARLLRAGTLGPEKAQRAYETIERSARSQAQLIEDLLDVSRIVSGKLRLDVRPIELAPPVEAAVETARPAGEAKQVRLQVTLDPRAGPVAGDPERLQQVVWNLVSNAVKFTPRGGRVQVHLARVNSHVELTVRDTGCGIEAALLPHVFDRFRQGAPKSGAGERGLGLGLAIVRHIVELHGGTVSAHSPGPGRGAVFQVCLPLLASADRPADPGRRHPVRQDGLPSPSLARLDGVRVLVVDDEPDANEAVQALLDACGAEVRVAGSLAQALETLARWRPDVVVSDIEMPGGDGYELIARVRALDAGRGRVLPAIALTAYARVEDRVRALTAGYQHHVAKPVEPTELVAVVRSLAPPPHPASRAGGADGAGPTEEEA